MNLCGRLIFFFVLLFHRIVFSKSNQNSTQILSAVGGKDCDIDHVKNRDIDQERELGKRSREDILKRYGCPWQRPDKALLLWGVTRETLRSRLGKSGVGLPFSLPVQF